MFKFHTNWLSNEIFSDFLFRLSLCLRDREMYECRSEEREAREDEVALGRADGVSQCGHELSH